MYFLQRYRLNCKFVQMRVYRYEIRLIPYIFKYVNNKYYHEKYLHVFGEVGRSFTTIHE